MIKINLKIKEKSLKTLNLIFLTGILSIFFIFVSYLIIYKLLVNECLKIEKVKIVHLIQDVEFYFLQKIKKLKIFAQNWTCSDFILQNKNSNFIKSHITSHLFLNNDIDLFLYLNAKGEPKIGGLYDKHLKKIYVPLYLKNLIHQVHLGNKEILKIIRFQNKFFLLEIAPIFKNSSVKSKLGYLVVGKIITSEDINHLKKFLKLINIEIINSNKPKSDQIIFSKVGLEEIIALKPDFLGEKNLLLKITSPVDKKFIKNIIYTIITAQAILFFICAFLIIKLINFFIIQPVLNLTKDVKKLTTKRAFIKNKYNNEEINYLVSILNNFMKEIIIKEKIYTTLAEESENLVILINEKGEILYKNRRTEKIVKYENFNKILRNFIMLFKQGKTFYEEIKINNFWIKCYLTPVEDDLYLFIGYDITKFKKKEKELFEKAIYDPLTNLYNRSYFEEIFEKVIISSKKGEFFVLLFIDCDNLKFINDNYGHLMGDEALKTIGKIIKETIRKQDFAARWGGDEFAVILSNCTKKEGVITAQRILQKIKTSEIKVSGLKIKISVSIGLVEIDGTKTAEEILNLADTLVYEAKAAGGGFIKYF